MSDQNWNTWESQINRKTDRNRKAYLRRRVKKVFVVLAFQLALFVLAVTVLLMGGSGILNRFVSVFVGGCCACAFSFLAGYLIGGRRI